MLRLSHLDWKTDFGDMRSVADFKVADLACGTGTLLMAAAQAITDNFIKERADSDRSLGEKDLSGLHRTLMQNTLHGYDILPSAVHLTASTLALLAPEVAFRQMNLWVMPIGMDRKKPRLGSLDFLQSQEVKTQFALDDTHLDSKRTGAAKTTYANAVIPKLNLCVMNPPFVSSRYGNRLFGSLPEDRPLLQKELSARAKELSISATAGLGALFVPLADKRLADGGRIAFVLPVALATGEAWSKVRQYLSERYHLEVVITSHDPERTNFSENTALSEILFIAKKGKPKGKTSLTTYVGLRRNPVTIHEALDMASRLSATIRHLKGKQGSVVVRNDVRTLCTVTNFPSPKNGENWTSAIFSQSGLAQVHFDLSRYSTLRIPGDPNHYKLGLCGLGELGTLGYDIRDITDAFEVERGRENWTPYAGFWDHDASRVVQIAQSPNAFLTARERPIPGRKLKDATAVWSKAGTILLVSRLWPITHRVLATGFEAKTLGNTWWSFENSKLTAEERAALLVWLNSTLGLLFYFGSRAVTRSAWMQMKKPAWEAMPVLNVKVLPRAKLTNLSKAYARLATSGLQPLAQLDADPVRKEIDDAISAALGLPTLEPIRQMLSREPGLTGGTSLDLPS